MLEEETKLTKVQFVCCLYLVEVTITVFKIVFGSVQQNHLDKTIYDQQVVDFVQKIPHEPALYPFKVE